MAEDESPALSEEATSSDDDARSIERDHYSEEEDIKDRKSVV